MLPPATFGTFRAPLYHQLRAGCVELGERGLCLDYIRLPFR